MTQGYFCKCLSYKFSLVCFKGMQKLFDNYYKENIIQQILKMLLVVRQLNLNSKILVDYAIYNYVSTQESHI